MLAAPLCGCALTVLGFGWVCLGVVPGCAWLGFGSVGRRGGGWLAAEWFGFWLCVGFWGAWLGLTGFWACWFGLGA